MSDFLNKLSSYNLFNNLFPGILFTLLLAHFTMYEIDDNGIILNLFLYYFIGITISRFSSIIVEPLLKKIKFIVFVDYVFYVIACKNDNKIDILVEVNNMYRVLFTIFLLIFIGKFFYFININYLELSKNIQENILLALTAFIYLFSYRKQTNYICKRINANN